MHVAAITGSSRRVAVLGRALTLPLIGRAIAPTWALTWNDLLDGAPRSATTLSSSMTMALGRAATYRSRVRRQLTRDLHER
jgi:hypothetical protein